MIPWGSKPSSSTSIANDDILIPSNISSIFVMNWVEALTAIDCLNVNILEPVRSTTEEEKLGESSKDVMGTPNKSKPIEQTLKIIKDDEVSEKKKEDLEKIKWIWITRKIKGN